MAVVALFLHKYLVYVQCDNDKDKIPTGPI